MSPSELLATWGRLLMSGLQRAGVEDVVLSPGSRNTPFTWAALRSPGLRCHTIIDERSAAFFAVGHAKMTGRPVLLVCTSGSAAANYWPAVVEAAESGTPLLLLTADRPLELQRAASPQTIDQVKLFGDYARAYFDLGTPDAHPSMLAALPRLAAQAVLASRAPVPGPVQINARARKPLEPAPEPLEPAPEGRAQASGQADASDRAGGDFPSGTTVAFTPEIAPSREAIEALASACRGATRGLIVCGPEAPWRRPDPAAVAALARAAGFPVVAEPASGLRFAPAADTVRVDGFAALLETGRFRADHAPDLLLQLGRPPTSSAWSRWLDRWPEAERWVVAPYGWPDPWSSAAGMVISPIEAAIRALTAELDGTGDADAALDAGRREWSDRLSRADEVAREVVDEAVEAAFSEGAAVRAVVERVPGGGVLAVGNSLPVREVDLFAPRGERDIAVWSQRGANGIDGLISGAAGAAAGSGRPTTLLLGDVSFAHDIGGLAATRGLAVPLTIVVLNNGGGRIFERLPITDLLEGDDMEAWLTPPRLDLAAAALAFDVRYARADDRDTLVAALDDAATGGTTIVEVIVPEDGTTEHQRQIVRALEARLGR